jgi:hypothetical protein
MQHATDHQPDVKDPGLSPTDYLFILFIGVVIVCVTWLGIINYQQATKTELSKRNGEAWVATLTEIGLNRFDGNNKYPGCKGGVKPTGDASKGMQAGTWEPCLADILAHTDLKDQVNPFTGQAPEFIEKCIPTDLAIRGAIVIEDLMPTPPGSATPFVASQLINADAIDYKMQLRLSVCDKGGDAVKVAEFEF